MSSHPLLSPPFVRLLAIQASFGYAFSTFSLLPKYLAGVLGLDASQIGSVMGSFGITAVVLVPLVGLAVDRMGRRAFLWVGTCGVALTSLGFLAVEGPGWLLYALRLGQGVAFAAFFVSGLTIAADLAPSDRMGQAIGVFGVTNLVMNAIAPAGTEWISARFGWGVGFGLSAGLASLAAIGVFFVEDPRRPGAQDGAHARWIDLLRIPGVAVPSLATGLTSITLSVLFVFHQPYALAAGIENVSGFFVMYALGAAVARLGFGNLADRRGHVVVARFAAIPYALAPLLLIDVTWERLLLAGLSCGIGHGFLYPALNAVAVTAGGERARGSVMGVYLGAFNVGFNLSAPLLGRVAESAGYPVTCGVGAAFAVLALMVLLCWSQPRAGVDALPGDARAARIT